MQLKNIVMDMCRYHASWNAIVVGTQIETVGKHGGFVGRKQRNKVHETHKTFQRENLESLHIVGWPIHNSCVADQLYQETMLQVAKRAFQKGVACAADVSGCQVGIP